MLVIKSVNDYKHISYRDSQRKRVYKLDNYLCKLIRNLDSLEHDIFSDFNNDKNIVKLTERLLFDLGLSYSTVSISDKVTYGSCGHMSILYSLKAYQNEDVELVFHE
jgi:hypothetical protein